MSKVTKAARDAFAAYQRSVKDNFFLADPHLQSLLSMYHKEHLVQELTNWGQTSAREVDTLARECNTMPPRLARYDGFGNRTEGIIFPEEYHTIGRLTYATGVMAKYATPGCEFDSLAIEYLLTQNGECGHGCPLACTAGLIKILQKEERREKDMAEGDREPGWKLRKAWLDRLLDPDYNTHFHGAQFMTEVQGGGDVGANVLEAKKCDPLPCGLQWRLYGEKWFCSVIDAHLWLVVARPEGAGPGTKHLRAFAVPRNIPGGEVNDFKIRRLKDKLGTRSMASAEVDFEGAWALPVGDFREALDLIINTSRVYNAASSTGMLQRSYLEASNYAKTRMAYGTPIISFPAVQRAVASLRVEAYAARAITFFLAAQQGTHRMLVNLNKYWTAAVTTQRIHTAIEVFGGNGAIEEFGVLPRLLRDSVVCEQWEGPHNVLVAQAVRDSARAGLVEGMFKTLLTDLPHDTLGTRIAQRLEAASKRWAEVASSDSAALLMRDVIDDLRVPAQAAFLHKESVAARNPDPLLPLVIDHLLTTSEPGYDPVKDPGLATRVAILSGTATLSKL